MACVEVVARGRPGGGGGGGEVFPVVISHYSLAVSWASRTEIALYKPSAGGRFHTKEFLADEQKLKQFFSGFIDLLW